MADAPGSLVIERGSILAYRVLDVADEILLDHAEAALTGMARLSRVEIAPGTPGAIAVTVQPVALELGIQSVELPRTSRTVQAQVSARFFAYGAVSILFEIPIAPGTSVKELTPLCDELHDTAVLTSLARAALAELLPGLEKAVVGRHTWEGYETYTVLFVESLAGTPSVKDVLAAPELPKLLIGELSDGPLAAIERADVLKHTHSYLESDVVVVDWNSAFVLEPSGSRDIPDVLEIATAQLLELRYYDALFDRELGRIYGEVDNARRRGRWNFGAQYTALARNVRQRLVELSELTERIGNAVKLLGDFYLARVYTGALSRFQIKSWEEAVLRKQRLLAGVYDLLKGEVDTRRGTLLEITVVVLILFEIVMALVSH